MFILEIVLNPFHFSYTFHRSQYCNNVCPICVCIIIKTCVCVYATTDWSQCSYTQQCMYQGGRIITRMCVFIFLQRRRSPNRMWVCVCGCLWGWWSWWWCPSAPLRTDCDRSKTIVGVSQHKSGTRVVYLPNGWILSDVHACIVQ